MKKIYVLILCFGIAFVALSIPNIEKINSFVKKAIEKEKVDKKPVNNAPKKAKIKVAKSIKPKSANLKVVAVVPNISIAQTVSVEGGGNAVPGGQLNFSFLISNSGTIATGVSFTDQLIADLTLVPGSLKSTPIAGDDSYSSTGNVGITVPAGSGVLINDNSPTNVAMTVALLAPAAHGSASLSPDGSFTYLPTAGYVGADSFTYTLTTGTTSSVGTVNITVSDMIWFVNPAAGVSGTGTLQSPFKNMNNVVGTAAGNTIFVYSGAPTGALTLLANQKLVGQGATAALVGPGSISGIILPSFSNATPSTGGVNPTWSNAATALTLNTANDVEGIDISASSGTTVTGASVGALKVREVSLANSNGQSLQITAGGALDIIFKTISSTGGTKGISVNNSTGSFQILGTGTTNGSGGTISTKSARGAEFVNCTNVTLKNMAFTSASTTNGSTVASDNSGHNAAIHLGTVTGATLTNIQISGTTAQHGINLNNVSTLAISNTTVSNCGNELNENCLTAYGLSGTCSIANSTFQFGAQRVAYILNTGAQNLTLNVSNSSFNDVNTDVAIGGDGFLVYLASPTASGTSTVNITNSTFLRSINAGIHAISEGNATLNLNVNGSTISPGTSLIGLGMNVESLGNGSGRSKLNFNIGTNAGNNITSRAGITTNFFFQGKADGEGRLTNNILRKNNILMSDNVGSYVRAAAQEFSTLKIEVNGNNCDVINSGGGTGTQYGFDIFSRGGTSSGAENARVDAIVTNNIVKVNSTLQAINIASGASEAVPLNLTTCARVALNTTTQADGTARNFRVRMGVLNAFVTLDQGSVINGNADDAAVGAYWDFKTNTPPNATNVNTVVLSSVGGAVNPFRITNATVCVAPNNPAAPARLGVEEVATENSNPTNPTIDTEIAKENSDLAAINSEFSTEKVLAPQNQQHTLSSNASAQSGELITVNGSGSGFTLPQGKNTTITFSATIANPTAVCDMTNVGNTTNPSVQSNTTSTPLVIPIITGGSISSNVVCSGGTIDLMAACPVGSAVKWYTENGGGGSVASGDVFSPTNIISNTSYYAACQIGPCVSARTLVGSVTVNQNPDATITANNSVCQNGTLNLNVAGGATTYLWSGDGIVVQNSNATTAQPTYISTQTYRITVTDGNGCSSTSSKNVIVNATPVISAGADQTICNGTSATLTGKCIYNVYTTLSGANENPANGSSAIGYATGTFDPITNQLDITVIYSGLAANASAAHIHGPAAVGVNAGVLIGFSGVPAATSGTFSYSGVISSANAGHLLAGNTYINIHNATFPAGEIRGQLTANCAADTYVWNPGALNGISTAVSPNLTQLYTLTASNAMTGCTANASTTVNVTPVTLPAVFTTKTQDVGAVPLVANDCEYLAKVVPTNFSGNATVSVWVETIPPFIYVPRHYEITPAVVDPNTATGTITLFFTQADFDAYNGTLMSQLLPTGPGDAAGIANFQILKFSGTSLNGLPEGYPGGGTLIPSAPDAWNSGAYTMVWNATNLYWEVTFPVSGFSGFFAKSASQALPVNLISFTGKKTGERQNTLKWITANEKAFKAFEIQRSSNTKSFESIGTVNSIEKQISNLNNYQFVDNQATGNNYYRLKMVDLDGKYNYSKIISIENSVEQDVVGQFYPNPSTGKVYVDINSIERMNWSITTYDILGKTLNSETKILQKGMNKVMLDKLAQGFNFVRFENGKTSEIRKVIKQ